MDAAEKQEPERLVAERIAWCWEDGCPVASGDPNKSANIAVRRWFSSSRRKVKAKDREAKIRDLAKGLVQTFEEKPELVGPIIADYLWLAEQIAEVLEPSEKQRRS